MASYTTNLNLKKPAGSENVAIGDINNNMDAIDAAYGTLNSKMTFVPATATDLDSANQVAGLTMISINSSTLNTPYKAGKTSSTSGFVFGVGNGNYRVQFAILSGNNNLFLRSMSGGTWGEWNVFYAS